MAILSMPAFVKTPADEKRWRRAKEIVADQRHKSAASLTDEDYRLVNHIYQGMVTKANAVSASDLPQALQTLQRLIRAAKDQELPPEVQALVKALSTFSSYGGQSIALLRKSKTSGMDAKSAARLAEDVAAVAARVKILFEGLKGDE